MMKDFLGKIQIIDDNFLSADECLYIKNTVLSVKDKWQHEPSIPHFDFLSRGAYTFQHSVDYIKNVKEHKEFMWDLFSDYYLKIVFKLREIFQLPIDYHENLHYPGFHISNGISMPQPNFHTDGFPLLNTVLTGLEKIYFSNAKIFSLIIPIANLSKDSGLLIRYNNKNINRQDFQYDDTLDYQQGMLAIWDGKILHSIKPFTPVSFDDYRITMQLHVALAMNKGYIFW